MLLLNKNFNRHAVAIPARHIDRIEARHLLRFDNNVFQHLVDRMTDMNGRVGVGRAIVQNKFRLALARGTNFFVKFFILPLLDPSRLTFGELAAHGERRVGQIQGRFVIGFGRWRIHRL